MLDRIHLARQLVLTWSLLYKLFRASTSWRRRSDTSGEWRLALAGLALAVCSGCSRVDVVSRVPLPLVEGQQEPSQLRSPGLALVLGHPGLLFLLLSVCQKDSPVWIKTEFLPISFTVLLGIQVCCFHIQPMFPDFMKKLCLNRICFWTCHT